MTRRKGLWSKKTSTQKKHQGEQSNHNHCRDVKHLSHLITHAQWELLSISSLLIPFLLILPSSCKVCVCVACPLFPLCNHFYLSSVIPLVLPILVPLSIHPSTPSSFKNHKTDVFFLHSSASITSTYPL